MSADGPLNINNAVAIAADPAARGRGVLVAVDDDILPGSGDGAVRCQVVEETETPFTYIVALTPEGVSGRSPLRMELPRENWLRIRALRLDVVLPPQKLLWLRAQEER